MSFDDFTATHTPSSAPNVLPVAAFSVSSSDLSVTVDGSGSVDSDGSIVGYAWDFGDGRTASGVKPGVHTYATAGSKTIKLTVTDDRGATHTTSKTVSVVAPNVLPVAAGAKLPISYSLSSLSGTVYYLAPGGSDAAAGSVSAPLATLAGAVAKVGSGQSATIVVRGGTYRQGNVSIPAGRTIRVVAYPGEVPVFSGARVVSSGWVGEGSLSYAPYVAQPVTNGSGISFSSGQNLTGDGVGKYPDQAWVGSTQLRQVSAKSAVAAGTFWVDSANARIYLASTDVAKGNIEVSSRDQFLRSAGPGTTLEGITVSRFSPSGNDGGALHFGATASGSVMRNVRITEISFQAVQYSGWSPVVKGALLENVTIANCNWMGISANVVDDLVLRRVSITNMNMFSEFLAKPQSGALKTSRVRGAKVLDSVISNNKSNALWFDQSNVDVDVVGNTMSGNTGTAVFFEISDDLLLANNFISAPGEKAVRLHGSSGLKLVNNTIVGGAQPVGIYTDVRSMPGCADPSKPLCPESYSSDRDTLRPRPATLDWMPRLDLMLNNVIVYPSGSGWCGTTTFCITLKSGTASTTLEAVIHKADPTRGIPQTVINGNVYANGTGSVIHAADKTYTSASAFAAVVAASPVSISGAEANSKTGNSWVNPDGTPTAALAAAHSQAAPVPTHPEINQYIPAGTRHYGSLG
jgi:PKD repeat protein